MAMHGRQASGLGQQSTTKIARRTFLGLAAAGAAFFAARCGPCDDNCPDIGVTSGKMWVAPIFDNLADRDNATNRSSLDEMKNRLGTGGDRVQLGVKDNIRYVGEDVHGKDKDFEPSLDRLNRILSLAVETSTPLAIGLIGNQWCNRGPLVDELLKDPKNFQWYSNCKPAVGSSDGIDQLWPFTLSPYALAYRNYKERNARLVAQIIAEFAVAYPDLFIGVDLDPEQGFTVPKNDRYADYSPLMIQYFRDYERAVYGGDVKKFNQDFSTAFASFGEVIPPKIPSTLAGAAAPAAALLSGKKISASAKAVAAIASACALLSRCASSPYGFNGSPYWEEWMAFRSIVVDLDVEQTARWASESGIPKEKIFTHQSSINDYTYYYTGNSWPAAISQNARPGITAFGAMGGIDSCIFSKAFEKSGGGWGLPEFNPCSESFRVCYDALETAYYNGASYLAPLAWEPYKTRRQMTYPELGSLKIAGSPFEAALKQFLIDNN